MINRLAWPFRLARSERSTMRRGAAAAELIPDSTMRRRTPAGVARQGQPSAQRSTAVPTREHQTGGQPHHQTAPAHRRAPHNRAPPAFRRAEPATTLTHPHELATSRAPDQPSDGH